MANDVTLPREDNKVYILEQSHVEIPHTGIVGATTLKTVRLPGGSMGRNGMVRITSLWSWNNSAGSKTVQVAFGGQVTHGGSGTTTQSLELCKHVRNAGAENSQVLQNISNIGTATSTAVSTIAVNTAADVDITFVANLAVGTDNISLRSYCIEVLPGR